MPEYTYRCQEGHECLINEGMFSKVAVMCQICGNKMWRKPQVPAINWNGLKPSQGELAPAIQEMVDNEDENRDNYLGNKEK